MARVIWSPEAVSDLDAICAYIARDSEHYARVLAARVLRLVGQIAQFPDAGRIVPEYHDDRIRERPFQNYRIIYRTKSDAVEIVTIIHAARMLPDV